MAQEQRTVAELDTKCLVDIAEFERVIINWFSKKENPIFQIRVEDVAQYATASTSSFGGEEVKNDLCETLDASLLDAPDSIVEKLIDKDNNHTLESVIVVVKLIVNGFLPPPGLRWLEIASGKIWENSLINVAPYNFSFYSIRVLFFINNPRS
ncbi:hypothetical protein F1880_005495 [Penicillium rolfsii]|nr:hypothetical protein F1880_005495 [Penicillium rolfsii]